MTNVDIEAEENEVKVYSVDIRDSDGGRYVQQERQS